MADVTDVEIALTNVIANAIMPQGYLHHDVAVSPLLGFPIRLAIGWPIDNELKTDILNGVSQISVYTSPGLSTNRYRYLQKMTQTHVRQAAAPMTVHVSGNTVTFGGSVSASQVIGISCDQHGFSYRLQAGDTPASVAATFAASLPNASANGTVVTIASTLPITAATGGDVTTLTEVGRQEQIFQVNVWADTVSHRRAIASAIDPLILIQDRLTFPDGSISGPIKCHGSHEDDFSEKMAVWRRTNYYCIEYPIEYASIDAVYALGETTGQIKTAI